MSDPISSSKWTGSLDKGLARPRSGVFTHRIGEPTSTGEYARIAEAQRQAGLIPAELRRVILLAAILLFSPLLLWVGRLFLGWASRDQMTQANSNLLLAWGLGAFAFALWQVRARSIRLIGLREAMLSLALLASVLLPAGYVYLGVKSHTNATASAPERTFEWYRTSGRSPFKRVDIFHQRADGTFVERWRARRPLEYGRTCALVQRLDGDYGFGWIRVLGRSRPPARGQLSWPVRREECFSETPLSTLPR